MDRIYRMETGTLLTKRNLISVDLPLIPFSLRERG
jgi:hypothetical protein